VWVAVIVVVAAAAIAIGGGANDTGNPLDPRSTAPDGTRALVELLERFGARVDLVGSAPAAGTADVALVLEDRFGRAGGDTRAATVGPLEQWARSGGRLIVADPSSPFVPKSDADDPRNIGGDDRVGRGDCDVTALTGVDELLVPPASWYRVPAGASRCFTSGADALVVVQPYTAGTLVSIGSPELFVNSRLDRADNSVLAVALLAPSAGTRVAIVEGPPAGSGDKTLADLIPTHVQLALAQLAIAFVIYALWRARRLGRPVTETAPVEIDASELVVAVGRLLERSHAPDVVAARLRTDTRRVLASRLGLRPDATPAAIANAAAVANAGIAARVEAALSDRPITDDTALVALAQELDAIRTEVLR
jgi:hypothetical protein